MTYSYTVSRCWSLWPLSTSISVWCGAVICAVLSKGNTQSVGWSGFTTNAARMHSNGIKNDEASILKFLACLPKVYFFRHFQHREASYGLAAKLPDYPVAWL